MRIRLLLATLLAASLPGAAQTCDRACLKDVVTKYLDSLVKHDSARLPLAPNARFTEDGDDKKVGEGLWRTAGALGTFRQDILDVKQSTAGVHAVILEDGKPTLVATRLKVVGGKVSEIESMVVRTLAEGMIFKPEAVKEANPAINITPTADQRMSREQASELALRYPAGLKIGSFVKSDARFGPQAYRFENGQLMAGPGCTFLKGCDNIREQQIPTLSGIKYKVAAVDEEQGIVWLRMNFGPGSVMRTEGWLDVFEMFKVYGGAIQAVEAFMKVAPVGKPSGWD